MIILADDIGIGDINGRVKTPNIDKLAQLGTSFDNAHSTPICAPSRYVLLSGNYQQRGRNAGGTWTLKNNNNFKPGQQSLAQVLKEGGNYMTNVVGKWHLGARIPPKGMKAPPSKILSSSRHDWTRPVMQGARHLGFESSYITYEGIQGSPYTFFRNDFLATNEVKYWEEGNYTMPHGKSMISKAGQGTPKWDSTAYNMILVNETERFLDRFLDRRKKNPGMGIPFFSYVALGAAHIPHSPPDKCLNGDPIAHQYPTRHMDMILELDKVVGSLMQALEERNLVKNTVIIFLSDNGGLGNLHGSSKFNHHSNARLRGSKGQVYEGGHRIPLIMRYDGLFPANQRRSKLIGINDIFATVCDLVHVKIPKGGTAIDSKSFLDYAVNWKKKEGLRNTLGVWNYKGGKPKREAMLTNRYKLVHFPPNCTYPDGIVEYYDLKADPGEKRDLSKKRHHRKGIQLLMNKLDELHYEMK